MKRIFCFLIVFGVLALLNLSAEAEVPQLISYQGVLTDDTGQIVADGTYQLTFSIYDVSSGGSALWTEVQDVPVTDGLFTAMLGSVTALLIEFDTDYYMGISVEGGDELTPRVRLCSSPYSLSAGMLAGSDNMIPSSGDVGFGTAIPEHKVHIVDTGYDDVVLDIQSSSGSGELKVQTDSDVNNYLSVYKGGSSTSGTTAGFPLANASRLVAGLTAGPLMLQVMSGNPLYMLTDNTERVRITGSGDVGIGTTSPAELLDVAGGIRVGNSSGSNAGTIRWTGSDFEGYDGSSWSSLTSSGSGSLPSGISGNTLRHNGTDWTAAGNLYNDGTSVGIGTTTPAELLDVDGNIHASGRLKGVSSLLGSASMPGSLTVERFGSTMISATSSGDGGTFHMYDDAGEYIARIIPDSYGEGAFMGIFGASHSGIPEIILDGNYEGTGDPFVKLSGNSRTVAFNTSLTGDESVEFPGSAISSLERSDEPGVTTSTDGVTTIDLPYRAWTVIEAVTISAPADGYVIVIGSCQGRCDHTNMTSSIGYYGVSATSTNAPANQYVQWSIPYAQPTGLYVTPVTVHGVFTATEGSNNYFLMGYEYEGDYSAVNIQLSAIYVPTSYGGVGAVAAGGGEEGSVVTSGKSAADIGSEQADAVSADRERMKKELAQMREQFRRLEEKVERLYRDQ